ncbi:hypothetical protein Tco_0454517 [Tanacetum coccineum]
MPPRMMTRSAGRATVAPRGGRTGERTGRGGGRTRGRYGDQGNGGIEGQGGQVGGQGTEVNDGVDRVPDFSTIIAQQLHNLLPTILAQVGNQATNLAILPPRVTTKIRLARDVFTVRTSDDAFKQGRTLVETEKGYGHPKTLRTAFATSVASARVGLGNEDLIIDSSICVAVTTGFPFRLHL